MQKIGNITSTADENSEFTNGVVAAGKVPTILDAAWFNTIQRELVKVVEGAGLAINPPDDTQIYQAIKLLANGQIEIASDADIQNGSASKLVDAKGLFNRTETGRKPSFNQSFCDAIGGYPKGAILLGADGITLWQSIVDANVTDPDSVGSAGWALMSVKTPKINIVKFENSGTYTPTPGTQFIIVEAVGGGGAGGGASVTTANSTSVGSGGGSGGYCKSKIEISEISGSVTVTVGAGGVGASGISGGSGGGTTFGAFINTSGGAGGLKAGQANDSFGVSGANGGVATGGTLLNIAGNRGGNAFTTFPRYTFAGAGASGNLGNGGIDSTSMNGRDGSGYGSGGGGVAVAGGATGTYRGGNGAAGVVIITEFIVE